MSSFLLVCMTPAATRFIHNHGAIILAVVSIALYLHTINHDYALDDYHVITTNEYVQRGVQGIPGIITHAHWYHGKGYRPIPAVMFAIEHELFGDNPRIGHAVNVVLYAFIGVVLLAVLRLMMPGRAILTFCIALLFCVHPVHTEVVANIKSRDELCALLFGLGAWFAVLQGIRREQRNRIVSLWTIFAAIAGLCAVGSKETGLVLVLCLPLVVWTFTLMKPDAIGRLLLVPLVSVVVFTFITRATMGSMIVDYAHDDIINNSLPAATTLSERFGTAMTMLGRYVLLLFVPHPLLHDYSYRQIPFHSLFDPVVIMWALLYLAGAVFAGYGLFRRHPAGFGIALFLLTLAPVSNIPFLIGTTMAERFLFIPSLGLCITTLCITAAAYHRILSRYRLAAVLAGICILLLFSIRTITRAADWRDNGTLFSRDIHFCPNNANIHASLGNWLLIQASGASTTQEQRRLSQTARRLLTRAIAIYPDFFYAHGNLALAHEFLGTTDSALVHYRRATTLNPSDAVAWSNAAGIFFEQEHYDSAVVYARQARTLQPGSVNLMLQLADSHAMSGKLDSAVVWYEKVLDIDSGNARARALLEKVREIERGR